MLSTIPKLLNLNQDFPSKKWLFWSNHYKVEVMVTPFIEMLELPNFDQMAASTISFKSCNKILVVRS